MKLKKLRALGRRWWGFMFGKEKLKTKNRKENNRKYSNMYVSCFVVSFLPQNGARCAPSGSLGWKKAKTLPNAKNFHRRLSQKYVPESLPDWVAETLIFRDWKARKKTKKIENSCKFKKSKNRWKLMGRTNDPPNTNGTVAWPSKFAPRPAYELSSPLPHKLYLENPRRSRFCAFSKRLLWHLTSLTSSLASSLTSSSTHV